ncbi:hypothetical protein ACS0TY_030672 [Phlomoides rotata]
MSTPSKSEEGSSIKKYMECQKNHAAGMGGFATDGCGEFMAGGEEGSLEALKCCACNCHRNFHRKIQPPPPPPPQVNNYEGKKRHRTKFSAEQKEKMLEFAEKGEWKLQKMEDSEVRRFCQENGIKRKVLKVWMHNNKYHYAKKTNHH